MNIVKCYCKKEIIKGIFMIEKGELLFFCNNKCYALHELNKKEECEHDWIIERTCKKCGKEQPYVFCKECRYNGQIRNCGSVIEWCFINNIGLTTSRKEGYCINYEVKKKEETCIQCNKTFPLEELELMDWKPNLIYACKDCKPNVQKNEKLDLYIYYKKIQR